VPGGQRAGPAGPAHPVGAGPRRRAGVDGGGLLHRALVGDAIAGLAVQNGWAGIVVNEAIRDSAAIGAMPVGVKALGTNPRRCAKSGLGAIDVAVGCGGGIFPPGAHPCTRGNGSGPPYVAPGRGCL